MPLKTESHPLTNDCLIHRQSCASSAWNSHNLWVGRGRAGWRVRRTCIRLSLTALVQSKTYRLSSTPPQKTHESTLITGSHIVINANKHVLSFRRNQLTGKPWRSVQHLIVLAQVVHIRPEVQWPNGQCLWIFTKEPLKVVGCRPSAQELKHRAQEHHLHSLNRWCSEFPTK